MEGVTCWALPEESQEPDDYRYGPPEGDYYYFDQETTKKETTIRRYPTGGPYRLSLVPAGDLPALSPSEIYTSRAS